MRTAIRTCPLCEATCGLTVEVDDATSTVGRVRGDADDVFSRGFLCPKGVHLKALHEDPDRVHVPLVKQDDGTFAEATWDEAFARVDAGLRAVVEAGGKDAVAAYLGNPSAHSLGALAFGRVLLKALGTKNIFSASTVDQYPKQMASAYLFGSGSTVAVPDLDRTDFLLILGANPMASNGSLMTAPDVRGRLRAIRSRGGRIVVVDPRRTRTVEEADQHLAIRPGTDALLLAGLVNEVLSEGLDAPQPEWVSGLAEVRDALAAFTPEAVAAPTGVEADVIRRLARELAAAPTAAVYGRIGTTTQTFGTTASWLVDVLNCVTGNLDAVGGAMFADPAAGSPGGKGAPGRGRGATFARWSSRVRGLGELFGELPVAALAEEIQMPGPGQVRALITVGGNPASSTPNVERLHDGLASLDFMVCVDLYVNETTRHADVILPSPSPLERSHYDLALYGFAIRNVANYSPPALPLPDGSMDEWRILLRLTGIVTGQGPKADVDAIDRFVATEAVRRETGLAGSVLEGADPDQALAVLAPHVGPERLLDLLLRCGPFGAGFPELERPGPGFDGGPGLTLDALITSPHGIDCGPLAPRLPGALRTASGTVELAAAPLLADLERLAEGLGVVPDPDALLLVGRRDLRSNNSWMHNLPGLVSGPARCTAHVHPDDATRLGVLDGEGVRVTSRAGSVELTAEVTDAVRPGVVSIPHGWGHDGPGLAMGVAREHAGVNANVLTDELEVEPLSGTAILNGVPVTLAPVREPTAV